MYISQDMTIITLLLRGTKKQEKENMPSCADKQEVPRYKILNRKITIYECKSEL